MRSMDHGPAFADTADLGEPVAGPVWLEPWPEPWSDPAASYERTEDVELAFVAALASLPPSQRAALVLREVLQFPAAEVAGMLGLSTAAVNSALQRARRTVGERGAQRAELEALGPGGRRELVGALVGAWERADVDAIAALLTEDARFTMPPLPAWFDGRDAVLRFFSERVMATPWRLRPAAANGQLALAAYQGHGDGFRLGAVNVLGLRGGRVAELASFLDPAVHAGFGLPPVLER
jgi:RNA polymerase sigma-70 factor (ECF subfamily)